MPLVVSCSECGEVVYESDVLVSLLYIWHFYSGQCPFCSHWLVADASKIQIEGVEKINLDEYIVRLLKDNKGSMSIDYLREAFDNYSKGYLRQRLDALKSSDVIIETRNFYILTEKGWSVIVPDE